MNTKMNSMTASFIALKRIIEQYEDDENPVSAILEISLKDTNRTKNDNGVVVYSKELRASIRADFMRYIEAQLPLFAFAWNGVQRRISFIQVAQGKVHFYTRQGFADQLKAAYMKAFKSVINANVNQQPWVQNQTGQLSMEFIVSKPLVYLQERVVYVSDDDVDDITSDDDYDGAPPPRKSQWT